MRHQDPPERTISLGRNLRVDWVTVETVSALARARIQCVLLKGPALGRWLYDDPAERTYYDTDLLLRHRQISDAVTVVKSLGFEPHGADSIPGDRPTFHKVMVRHGDGGVVELHWSLGGIGAGPDQVWQLLTMDLCPLDVFGRRLDILAPSARALLIALHAAQHRNQMSSPLQDLHRGLERLPTNVWREAVTLAERLDAIEAFRAGLSLLPTGALLMDELQLPDDKRSVEIILAAQNAPPLATGLEWLAQQKGIRRKLALIFHKVFPPPTFMRSWSPNARDSFLGLVLSYPRRWKYLLVQVRPGWNAWRAARRQVDEQRNEER